MPVGEAGFARLVIMQAYLEVHLLLSQAHTTSRKSPQKLKAYNENIPLNQIPFLGGQEPKEPGANLHV